MTFGEYLATKKINEPAFRQGDGALFSGWEKEFSEVSPASFTQRHLFKINSVRRRFPLAVSETAAPVAPARAIPRPKIS